MNEHNAHHAFTLRPLEDPQFNYLPMWLQNKKEMVLSTFFTKKPSADGAGGSKGVSVHDYSYPFWVGALISVQQYSLFPLCMIAGRVNFYVECIYYAIKNQVVSDLVGMGLFWCWYGYLTSLFPTTQMRLVGVSSC